MICEVCLEPVNLLVLRFQLSGAPLQLVRQTGNARLNVDQSGRRRGVQSLSRSKHAGQRLRGRRGAASDIA